MGGSVCCGPGGRSRFVCPTVTRTIVLAFPILSRAARKPHMTQMLTVDQPASLGGTARGRGRFPYVHRGGERTVTRPWRNRNPAQNRQ